MRIRKDASGVRDKARALENAAQELLERIQSPACVLTSPEKARVMNTIATTLEKLSRINDQFEDWDKTIIRILDALKPYPEALKAVRAVL